jgi:hypothetical protein
MFRFRLRFKQAGRRTRCVARFVPPALETLESRTVPSVVPTFAVTQDWGSGFQAQLKLANQDPTPVPNWTLAFDYTPLLSDIWDAKIVSHSANHYVITNAGWNATLAGNSSVSFGFVAGPGNTTAKPSNYVLNGVPLEGSAPTPTLSINDVTVAEGNSGVTPATLTVSLSTPAPATVKVNFATQDGSAQAGSDYQAVSGTLTFNPGEQTKTIAVVVNGDTAVEMNETFSVNLSSPSGATLTRAQGTGTIVNDDTGPAQGNVLFQVTSDWASGFTGSITIRNTGTAPIASWSLEFDFAGQISSIWNASITSHVGNHFVVQNADWNGSIPAGDTVSFGFNGSPGHVTAGPTNYLLHTTQSTGSGSGGGTGGGTNHAPVANNDSAWTTTGQAVAVSILANDTDADGDTLSVTSVTQGTNGAVVKNSDGTVTYTPRSGFTGTDSFSYSISDGHGGTASATVAATSAAATASNWPQQVYAPFVDMTLYPMYDLAAAVKTGSVKYFNLAFITADSSNLPAWGGYQSYEVNNGAFDQQIRGAIGAVRALGGDVAASFGGAAGQELAQVVTSVSTLASNYQAVISAYNLTRIDFDIEGAAVADHASIDRRSKAIALVEQSAAAAGRSLQVWFTLPVLPTGLTADGLYVLQSALANGVKIGGVNIMAMDYGDSAAPSPKGQMGTYAIQAATSLFSQLHSLYGSALTDAQIWKMEGVTPMIGLNDVTSEVFDQAAAQQLETFAQQKGISELAMWSLNRDRQSSAGALSYVDINSSSILQKPFEFSQIFNAITH